MRNFSEIFLFDVLGRGKKSKEMGAHTLLPVTFFYVTRNQKFLQSIDVELISEDLFQNKARKLFVTNDVCLKVHFSIYIN